MDYDKENCMLCYCEGGGYDELSNSRENICFGCIDKVCGYSCKDIINSLELDCGMMCLSCRELKAFIVCMAVCVYHKEELKKGELLKAIVD
jgi:hypothetical protein